MEIKPLNGVNLGGWLVAEKWITPELFTSKGVVDEFNLTQSAEGRARLKKHHQEFIRAEDFAWLNRQGINRLRLPIGYWCIGNDAPYLSTHKYIKFALDQALKNNQKIILDLHALPGSQNGKHHSGKVGPLLWHTEASYLNLSLERLDQITKRFGQHPALGGVEPVNEPDKEIPIKFLIDYYQKSSMIIRANCRPGVEVILSDSFRPKEVPKAIARSGITDVVIDMHFYQTHSLMDKLLGFRRNKRKVRHWQRMIRRTQKIFPVIVGEWSGGLGINKKELDRRGKAAVTKNYIACQQKAYASARESYFWCYKMHSLEATNPWDYRQMVAQKLLTI